MASSNELQQLDWLKGIGMNFGITVQNPELDNNPLYDTQLEIATTSDMAAPLQQSNSRTDLSKSDLLKLVTVFEGEVQARDIVIAVLKSERLKQVANLGRYRTVAIADPYTALLRDCELESDNGMETTTTTATGTSGRRRLPIYDDKEMRIAADSQMQALERLSRQQQIAHQHMVKILKEAELKHRKVIQELEEEKCKHEHDTAQGDDITYGLEMDRTRLRQELDIERNTRKKLEKEVKRQLEMLDEERYRQKQIILLLLTERRKIIVKYLEERKRSEDLAQILSEEKARIDTMAEGLEEESKKALQMESELEKQQQLFDNERTVFSAQLRAKDCRCHELELEFQKLKLELDNVKSGRTATGDTSASNSSLIGNTTKIVQPTATVTSIPVTAPITGVALTVLPSHASRSVPPDNQQTVLNNKMVSTSTPHRNLVLSKTSTTSPSLPAKKGNFPTPGGRGVPPPIPPNKPVILAKQLASTTQLRRLEDSNNDKKKLPSSSSSGNANATTNKDNAGQTTSTVTSNISGSQTVEIFGQELANFQQVFVTMAATNNNT